MEREGKKAEQMHGSMHEANCTTLTRLERKTRAIRETPYVTSAGFVRVLENLESPGILLWNFPGLESPGKRLLILESPGNLFNSSKKYEMYGRQ